MKNRMLERRKRGNGSFFCFHNWEVIGEVGENWDIMVGIRILCRCLKCEKIKERSNYNIKEIPDYLINPSIEYR